MQRFALRLPFQISPNIAPTSKSVLSVDSTILLLYHSLILVFFHATSLLLYYSFTLLFFESAILLLYYSLTLLFFYSSFL